MATYVQLDDVKTWYDLISGGFNKGGEAVPDETLHKVGWL